MRRYIAFVLVFILLAAVLSGCQTAEEAGRPEDELLIVCTTFPQYDWVLQILGEEQESARPVFLMRGGTDLHNYQPTTEDILTISDSDVFIYVGGESDVWAEAVLKNAKNENMTVINLMETLGSALKEEEIIEGMEDSHDHDDGDDHDEHDEDGHDHDEDHNEDHDEDHGESDEHETEYDEHIWLSLSNAEILCTAIADALSAKNPGKAELYQQNLNAYTEKLSALDAEYRTAIAAAPGKVLLFGDRFPFRYLLDDYGLEYYAAFPGCSSEAEASFETIAFLAQKTEELNLHTIMVSETADKSIAETIKNNTATKDQQILVLDAMQSVKSADTENGLRYLSVMESNLAVLKEALK